MGHIAAILLLFASAASAGQLADQMASRTIRKFLEEITVSLNGSEYKEEVISSVINLANDQQGCVQMDEEGNCLWQIAIPGSNNQEKMKRAVQVNDKESTRFFISNLLQNMARKSFPLLKNHIFSIFSNDSGSLLPTPNTDVVQRIEVSTNLILVRSIEKIQKLASQIQHFRTPLITVSSILLVLVLCLFGSCIARQITEVQIRRKAKKSRKLETYFHRRTLQESMNSPPYETVNIEME